MKTALIVIVATVSFFVLLEALYIVLVGTSVSVPIIPREPQSFGGSGSELKFAVIGDSLSVGQGGDYQKGLAVTSARQLAKNHKVTMINTGVSGARTRDVLNNQLSTVLEFKPDVVLIIISANDINHLTPFKSIEKDFRQIVGNLKDMNPKVKIVTTGSPAMGSIPRFPWPVNAIVASRAATMNKKFDNITQEYGLYFARVAERTGKQFAEDDSLSAEDKFHPSDKGYELWNEVIGEQLDLVLNSK